ncbi:MAG TPA: hypothetical protein VF681_01310 [Abditibacteriaceae bacterium]|jgi:hypothetical protein
MKVSKKSDNAKPAIRHPGCRRAELAARISHTDLATLATHPGVETLTFITSSMSSSVMALCPSVKPLGPFNEPSLGDGP